MPTVLVLEKQCAQCGIVLPMEHFYSDAKRKLGRRAICKECIRLKARTRYAKRAAEPGGPVPATSVCCQCKWLKPAAEFYRHPAKANGLSSRCKSCHVKLNNNSERQRKNRYGVSREDFAALWAYQRGLCPICVGELRPGKSTHIDHCHETGVVRGLLCGRCNQGLGLLREEPDVLDRAAAYLRRHRL